tara:strand:+ start:211 stop:498 length:288 start_codon:yes stop_codon:yes gene_type:complete
MKTLYGILAASAVLAACATTPPTDTPDPVDPDAPTCAAPDMQHLVGMSIGEIDVDTLPQPTRVVRADMAVTMEYRAERMTLWLDRALRVERVQCG